jgi:hypothetical protein
MAVRVPISMHPLGAPGVPILGGISTRRQSDSSPSVVAAFVTPCSGRGRRTALALVKSGAGLPAPVHLTGSGNEFTEERLV